MSAHTRIIRLALLWLALCMCITGCLEPSRSVQREAERREWQAKMSQTLTVPTPPRVVPYLTDSEYQETKSEGHQPLSFIPTRISIPAIKLDATIEQVSVTQRGAMGVPDNYDHVGILAPWAMPGDPGNAVISGHVDHLTGPAVFYELKMLKPGDTVIVSNDEERELIFRVISVESFLTAESPLERIFGPSDKPHLNLITCTGKFNRKTQEHEKRLVVFTELSEE